MAVRNHVAARKPVNEPLVPARGGTGVVHEADANALGLDDTPLGQDGPEVRLVHVPVHSRHGRVRLELGERRERDEVARVNDEVGALEKTYATVWQASRAAREVRIAEKRDQGAPSTNRPSR